MQSKYLVRINGSQKPGKILHFWHESTHDTACRMWSTGGLDWSKQWEIRDSLGEGKLCHMCRVSLLKLIPPIGEPVVSSNLPAEERSQHFQLQSTRVPRPPAHPRQ